MQIEEFRIRYNLRQLQIENTPHIERELRQAAVLIAITHIDSELHVILTRRPTHLRAHPGQVSFPGGKVEKNDHSYIHTALREAEEEIALNQSNVEVVGQYPKMKTFTGFEITPVIGLVKQDFTPVLDPGEVDEIFTVPLSYLLKSTNRHKKTFKRNGQMFPVYFIPYQQHFIWGATAAMINSLCLQLQNKS